MIELRRNLCLKAEDIYLNILNVDYARSEVAVLDLTKLISWPELRRLGEIEDDIAYGNFICEDAEPQISTLDQDLPAQWIAHRDIAWGVIKEIVENPNIAYIKKNRSRHVTRICQAKEVTRATIHRYLQSYWRGGMIRNALLPRWSNCGGPGLERKPGETKRGRPRETGEVPGVDITFEMRQFFNRAINLFYKKNNNYSLIDTYHKCIELYFCNEHIGDDGKITLEKKPEYEKSGWPSFGQFKYWVHKDLCFQSIEKARMGTAAYEMRYRTKMDTTAANSWGPGARYEIDATVVDVTLRSRRRGRKGRTQILGRPVIYVVIDTFSRMIVGIYIGWDAPSWRAAMMALANVFEDKVSFCRSHGIEISHDQWPCRLKPTAILGDRGEMASDKVDSLIVGENIAIENTPPYRGDWKGVVETRFHILQIGFRPFVPGSMKLSKRIRGGKDPQLDALLDVDDFTTIVVDLALFHNNHHVLEGFTPHPGMTEAGVPPIPLHMWNWALPRRAGAEKTPDLEKVRFALMWRDKASMTNEGIKFRKLRYKCQDPFIYEWIKTKGRTTKEVEVSFDDRNMDVIYINVGKLIKEKTIIKAREQLGLPANWVACEISTASEAYKGLNEREVEALIWEGNETKAAYREEEILRRANFQARTEAIVQEARSDVDKLAPQSKKSKLKNLRENRAAERDEIRREEAHAFAANLRPVTTASAPQISFDPADEDADFDLPPMGPEDWRRTDGN